MEINKSIILYTYDDLSLTKEYFFTKKPSIQKMFIWIAAIIVIILLLWGGIAKFEEVIKVFGTIRPVGNISTVSNIVSGNVLNVSYKAGQIVRKDQILLEIDPTQLESEKSNLEFQIAENEKALMGIEAIYKSIEQKRNVIPPELNEASLRYDVWMNSIDRLEKIVEIKFYNLREEQSLPISMTTNSKLRDAQSEYSIAKNELENQKLSFFHNLKTEENDILLLYNINKNKFVQVKDSLANTKINAPIDGIIQEIKPLNKDDWITSGQELFKIIPCSENSLKVELHVPATLAGKISENMEIKMRFPSLPYNEFGGATGRIVTIAPDTTSSQSQAYFIVLCNIDNQVVSDKKGKEYPLKVGLEVDARIILSKRTILSYFLEKMNLWW